jgi:hypothetical protein
VPYRITSLAFWVPYRITSLALGLIFSDQVPLDVLLLAENDPTMLP